MQATDIEQNAVKRRGLTMVEAVVLVIVCVLHFMFASGPIWRHPWSPDANILWSYAPIPVLVALVLLRGRRLRLGTWMMGTFEIMVAKFVITAFILVGLWAFTNPPSPAVVPAKQQVDTTQVTSENAFIVIPTGAIVPHTDASPVELALGPSSPRTLVVHLGAPLRLVSGDGRMHTLIAPSIGLNVPVVAGAERTVVFAQPQPAEIDIGCGVHPNEAHTLVTVSAN